MIDVRKFYILMVLLFFGIHAKAGDVFELEDSKLKNYGFSYCLKSADMTKLSLEPAQAMGGYLQTGNHQKDAYDNIQKFIDFKLDKKQLTYTHHTLNTCLEIYHDPNYDKLIKQQRIYL